MRIFFFNDTATTEIYTLSLHDALPILAGAVQEQHERVALPWLEGSRCHQPVACDRGHLRASGLGRERSEEHTSELQSRQYLVCRLLLEKKNNQFAQPDMQSTYIFAAQS